MSTDFYPIQSFKNAFDKLMNYSRPVPENVFFAIFVGVLLIIITTAACDYQTILCNQLFLSMHANALWGMKITFH